MNDKMSSHPRSWLYGFAVAHVQRYLLASSRLRDIQGGSQVLEDLCGREFDRVRQVVGLGDGRILSQAAAGARLETSDADAVARLYALWPSVAERYAPGVLVQQALVDVEEAGGLAAAQALLGERLHAARTDPVCGLPAAGPLVARYARTGEPAEAEQSVGGEWELVDRATDAKVDAWRELKTEAREGAGAALDRRFLGPELSRRYRFAAGRESESEVLSSDADPYVAVVHADGNAVGRFIARLLKSSAPKESAAVFRRFSDALARATEEAAREAVREVLIGDLERSASAREKSDTLPILKARPIVLGGDDLTIILPARLAFDFTQRFLAAFERTTRNHLADLGVAGFEGLTACAGLAVTKEKFPFDRAYELAESLCSQAKRHAKAAVGDRAEEGFQVPSALAFHRVTSSLPEDAATVLAQELSGEGTRLTFEAYRVGGRPAGTLADFDALRDLAAALPGDQRGGFRGLLAELRISPSRAEEAFRRMCEVRNRRGAREETRRLDAALRKLTGGGLWRQDPGGELARTPLLDAHVVALTWRPVERSAA